MNLENNPENTRGGCARDALVRVLVVYPPRDFARSRQSLAATSLQVTTMERMGMQEVFPKEKHSTTHSPHNFRVVE